MCLNSPVILRLKKVKLVLNSFQRFRNGELHWAAACWRCLQNYTIHFISYFTYFILKSNEG